MDPRNGLVHHERFGLWICQENNTWSKSSIFWVRAFFNVCIKHGWIRVVNRLVDVEPKVVVPSFWNPSVVWFMIWNRICLFWYCPGLIWCLCVCVCVCVCGQLWFVFYWCSTYHLDTKLNTNDCSYVCWERYVCWGSYVCWVFQSRA